MLSLQQLGKKYVHGKHGPDTFDCAGMVWYIYDSICRINIYESGIGLSTTTKIITSTYGSIILYDEDDLNKNLKLLEKGDILFFHRQSLGDNIPKIDNKYPGHCGIYLGDNSFIHCSRPKKKVIINNLVDDIYWQRVLIGSKRIISNNKILKKRTKN